MKSVLFAILLLSVGSVFGQNINEEYNQLIDKSETFKDYKVIKINELNSFWKKVSNEMDERNTSISKLETELSSQKAILAKQENEINSLKVNVSDLQSQTSTIDILGLQTDKTLFKVLFLSIVLTLVGIIGFLAFQLKDKLSIAKSKVRDYTTLENKFEEFRKNALEKQMKLRRDLQTERNKLEEIQSV